MHLQKSLTCSTLNRKDFYLKVDFLCYTTLFFGYCLFFPRISPESHSLCAECCHIVYTKSITHFLYNNSKHKGIFWTKSFLFILREDIIWNQSDLYIRKRKHLRTKSAIITFYIQPGIDSLALFVGLLNQNGQEKSSFRTLIKLYLENSYPSKYVHQTL